MEREKKKTKKTQAPVSKYISLRIKVERGGNPGVFIVVPKSFSKKATDRNLFKRRIKSILRNSKTNNLPKNKSLTFFLKKDAKNIPFKELQREVEKLLSLIKRE